MHESWNYVKVQLGTIKKVCDKKKMVQNLLSSQKEKKMDNKMMHYLKTATNINSKVGIFLGNAR